MVFHASAQSCFKATSCAELQRAAAAAVAEAQGDGLQTEDGRLLIVLFVFIICCGEASTN